MPTQVFICRGIKMEPATRVALWLCLAGVLQIGWQLRYRLIPPEVWCKTVADTIEKGFSRPSPKWLELVAVVVPWRLLATPLVQAQWLVASRSVDFVLDRTQNRLLPEAGAPVPKNMPLDDTAPCWAAQDNGSIQPLPERVGPGGRWQQHDVDELNRRIANLLDRQKTAQRQAPGAHKTDS